MGGEPVPGTVDTDTSETASQALISLIETLRPGAPLLHGRLTLVPLYRERSEPLLPYRPLNTALVRGAVILSELAPASVTTLRAQNRGVVPVLAIAGEEVRGGRQHRLVAASVLIPPRAHCLLPVGGVEPAHWDDPRPGFRAGETASPSLRHHLAAQLSGRLAARGGFEIDQEALQAALAERAHVHGVTTPAAAFEDIVRQNSAALAAAERALSTAPEGAVGVAALLGGLVRCLDVFDRPETLHAYWPRLVRSSALDALVERARPAPADAVERLLERAALVRPTISSSPGLGLDVRLVGHGILGAALVHEGIVVHAMLFAHPRRETTPLSTGARIHWLRPSAEPPGRSE